MDLTRRVGQHFVFGHAVAKGRHIVPSALFPSTIGILSIGEDLKRLSTVQSITSIFPPLSMLDRSKAR